MRLTGPPFRLKWTSLRLLCCRSQLDLQVLRKLIFKATNRGEFFFSAANPKTRQPEIGSIYSVNEVSARQLTDVWTCGTIFFEVPRLNFQGTGHVNNHKTRLVLANTGPCTCIKCLSIGSATYSPGIAHSGASFLTCHGPDEIFRLPCRQQGCGVHLETRIYDPDGMQISSMDSGRDFLRHEQSHFVRNGRFKCAEKSCSAATQKFSDLKRHYESKHCKYRTKYPCNVIGCKYNGDNGFARKDKLMSHSNNVHKGKTTSFNPISADSGIANAQQHGNASFPPMTAEFAMPDSSQYENRSFIPGSGYLLEPTME